MTSGIRTVIYPVKDLDRAKTLCGKLLGVAPYADEPYYVGCSSAPAEERQAIRDVGGLKLIATVKDADGDVFGLLRSP
jgi:hypothetical protein